MASEQDTQSQAAGAGTGDAAVITIRVQDVRGGSTQFRLRRSQTLGRLMRVYRERNNLGGEVRFSYDGERVADDSTPHSLGMGDNDAIDVFQAQTGG